MELINLMLLGLVVFAAIAAAVFTYLERKEKPKR